MAYSKFATPLAGKVFGYLTVLQRAGSERKKSGGAFALWLCRCTCGQEVVARAQRLVSGRRKACARNGHRWVAPRVPGPGTKRQMHRSEHQSWESMWKRCTDSKHKGYKNYGGRSITVCGRWNSFELFLEDMGPKPTPQHTIERKDTNGNYEPNNCRWATRKEQARNQRRSVYVEYQGEKLLLLDLADRLGLSRNVIYQRLKLGWSLDDALSVAVGANRGGPRSGAGRKKKIVDTTTLVVLKPKLIRQKFKQ